MKKRLSIFGVFFFIRLLLFSQSTYDTSAPVFKVNSEVFNYPQVQWIKGTPVKKFDSDKIYVIECWATWCAPCIEGIPHLNELSKKFKDKIIFVGQSVWEDDKEKVIEFVNKRGDNMNYNIAFSGGDESDFVTKWLKAANLSVIPQTFIIQDNKVVWITHPASLTENTLQMLIDKQFSLDTAEKFSPFRKLQEAGALLKDNKLTEAGEKIDSALIEYPGFSVGTFLKLNLLKKQGKSDEALSYAKNLFLQNPEGGRLTYYDELMEAEKYNILIPLLDEDINKRPDDIEAIMLRYKIYINLEDYASAATMINKATNHINNVSDLTRLALIDKYVQDSVPHLETEEAILKAGQKLLSLNPGHYNVALSVAQRLFMMDKEAAAGILSRAIDFPKENEKQKMYDKVLDKILFSIKSGFFPSEEKVNEWRNEIFKD